MTWREIRASFLEYFERNGHRVVPSSSLVPHDDPSLLFTNAGMNQFKDVFLGKEQREYKRAASCQKCMRVSGKHNDLENVGPSPSHHTFFQMLGNFSFGDYFKKDAIGFAWELLTDVWKIPQDRLFVTVFKGEGGIPRDVEAREFWLKYVSEDHLSELGSDDNFWQMGETGPCGRCSEIYYFRGNQIPCPEPVCRGVECSCSRYIEIWNNVFMEFDRQANGALNPLPAPSIDTGMGLERITAVLQGHESNYDTDLFAPILDEIGKLAGKQYGRSMSPDDVSMRVMADHSRTAAFLIADGVMPSNEFRGYVLRKIMRRAMRHGIKLGITETFLPKLVDVIVREMGDAYPELRSNRDTVVSVVRNEEERFSAVLAESYFRIENLLAAAEQSPSRQISGDEAFKLHDTFGVPLDFVEDIAGERRVSVDREGFERAMQRQQENARSKSAFEGKKGQEFVFSSDEAQQGLSAAGDRFEGYTTTTVKGTPVIALFDKERRQVKELKEGSEGYAALGQTPFYLEAGGQVSDVGNLHADASGASAHVGGMSRIASGLPRLHRIQLTNGTLHERDIITAEVDETTRDATRRNHTATHLLHAALAKGAGVAREAGRVARRARSAAIRLRALVAAHPRAGAARSSRSSTSRSTGTRPSSPRSDRPRKRWPRARWRSSAKSTAIVCASCRFPASAWSYAAAPIAARPATSASSRSCPRGVWRPAFAASRRSPARAPCSTTRRRAPRWTISWARSARPPIAGARRLSTCRKDQGVESED